MLPILEYCCLEVFCKPNQSMFTSLSDLYHNLASPVKVKQNLCTLIWSWNLYVSIQLFVLRRWASASLSGLLEYSGLKWDQFNGGICGAGRCSASGDWGAFGTIGICALGSEDLLPLQLFFYFWYIFFHLLIIHYRFSFVFFLLQLW